MNKKELIKAVAETTGNTQKLAGEIIESTLSVITDTLATGEEVSLFGFGKFETVHKEEREAQNPRTLEKVVVPAHNTLKFKASESLKSAVR